ncbi:MAG: sterol desaturase family protein, partial [Candidatus Thermoplasmatota archaeon]|nr:sterol desaturase family protein [Candidatus Thermoplasmatota archaeon]
MEESIGFKTRLFSMILRILTLLMIAGALYISTDGIFIVLLLFILVVPFEKLFPRHKGQKIRRPHLDTDIGYALASPLLGLLTGFVAIVVGILSLAWIPGLLVRPYVEQIPVEYMPIVGILLFDALVYWTHRFYHEIPVLWKFHAIHHSTEHLDWASGFRGHP